MSAQPLCPVCGREPRVFEHPFAGYALGCFLGCPGERPDEELTFFPTLRDASTAFLARMSEAATLTPSPREAVMSERTDPRKASSLDDASRNPDGESYDGARALSWLSEALSPGKGMSEDEIKAIWEEVKGGGDE